MGAAGLLPAPALADDAKKWPQTSVKIVLGFPPGQASDIIARILAEDLVRQFGVPFIVENRPGAGATLAAGFVAKAPKDGYTLLFSSSGPLTVAPNLYPSLGYDAPRDIDPVMYVGWSPLILLVPASSLYQTVKELVDASLSGSSLFYGSGGNGVTNHLAMELFKQASGARLTHVPYKGAGPALTDLIAGNIQVLFETATAAMPLITSGKLRALAVSSSQRYPELPKVLTVASSYPGFEAIPWGMICVPAGTPRFIKTRLEAALKESLNRNDVKQKMLAVAFVAENGIGPDKSRALVASETEKWKHLIQTAHIKLD